MDGRSWTIGESGEGRSVVGQEGGPWEVLGYVGFDVGQVLSIWWLAIVFDS